MQIIIVGCGKVGMSLASQLNEEGHDIILVDSCLERLQSALNHLDVNGIHGNGTSFRVLQEADITHTDILIAVTNRDEINLLSCLIARKSGNCKTIARVRDPQYYEEINFLKEELGLSMAINPEFISAAEIARLIQIPSAMEVDSFSKGRVNLITFSIPENSFLDGKPIKELPASFTANVLICIVNRQETLIIPDGNTVLYGGDCISMIVPPHEITSFFRKVGIQAKAIHNVLIAGGGTISYYLTKRLLAANIRVKIIEVDKARCELLSELLPKAIILNGDASDKQLLLEEGIEQAEAFVSLTNMDEENIMLSLFANKVSPAKRMTKINRLTFEEVVKDIPVGTVICPKNITANSMIRYVRSLKNSQGSNVEALYRMMDGRIEALEFIIRGKNSVTGIPLSSLRLKKNLLICCITRGSHIITPGGRDEILPGDTVVIVTTHRGLNDIQDILENT